MQILIVTLTILLLPSAVSAQVIRPAAYCTQGEIATGALIGGAIGLLGGTSATAALLSRGVTWTVGETARGTMLTALGGAGGGIFGAYVGGALACAVDAGRARMPASVTVPLPN
jgi:hypothetical protein